MDEAGFRIGEGAWSHLSYLAHRLVAAHPTAFTPPLLSPVSVLKAGVLLRASLHSSSSHTAFDANDPLHS